jgi:hypothetical protein
MRLVWRDRSLAISDFPFPLEISHSRANEIPPNNLLKKNLRVQW